MLNGAVTIKGSLQSFLVLLEMACAIIIFFLDIVLFVMNKRKGKGLSFLNSILLNVSLVLLTDVGAYYFRGNESFISYFMMRGVNFLYYLSCNMAAWSVVRYSLTLIESHNCRIERWIRYASDGVMGVSALSLVANVFGCFFFYVDEANVYHRGPLFILSQIPAAILIIILVYLFVRYRRNTSNSEKLAMLSYVVLPLIAEVVQVFVYGFSWLPISMAASAVLVIFQHFVFLPRRDAKEDGITKEGRSIQTKILIFVFVFITIFFSVTAKVAIEFASNRLDEEIVQHYKVLTDKTAEEISFWIQEEAQAVKNHKAALEILNDFSKETLQPYMEQIVKNYNPGGYIYDLYFTTPENVMCSGYGYEEANLDFTQREWYLSAVNSGEIAYTNPYLDSYTDRFVVTISAAAYDQNGKLAGVLALDMFVDKMFEIAENQEVPENSYLFMVDDDMCIMTHPNAEWGYRGDGNLDMEETQEKNYANLSTYIQEETHTKDYIYFEDYDGEERCFFTSKLEKCGWYIVAAISKEVVDRPKLTLGESIFLSLLVCLVLGVLLTLLATNQTMHKLAVAQNRAKEASEAKSRFLANMSHEIRTPINAVLGMDEILLRECKDEQLREYALNIQSSGQTLLGIINDVLDFSKIESNKMDIVPVKYNLGELIGNCVNMIQMRASSKCLEFQVERDEYLPKALNGDEVHIRQIIINLLTNAVKYTQAGSVTLYVGWKPSVENEGILVVRVSDTGMGITEEGKKELFTSFQRLDEKKNRNIEGTGLGLAITKQLVDLMEGQIQVESEYRKGSEFTVEIPQHVLDASNLTEFSVEKKEEKKERKVLRTKDAKILVVDDVLMNLRVVQGLLKGSDISIVSVQSGQEALEQIEHDSFDIIFLDHMMPEMDGIETFERMKELHPEVVANTPVIMLTANAISGVKEEYMKQGFRGYLSKPVSRDDLQRCLQEFLPKEKIVES